MPNLDLHVHTKYSSDGLCSLSRAVEAARAKGLSGIAIVDHNTVAGQGEAKKFSDDSFIVIPGLEITSSDGHIIGLGVEELIPRDLPAAETVRLIKEHGGVAIAAHPFTPWRSPSLVYKAKFDAIEGLNSRALLLSNPLAQKFAKKHNIPMVAGSDAHRCDEIGLAYTIFDCELKTERILEEVRNGRTSISGGTIPIMSFLWRTLKKAIHKQYEL